MRSMWVRCSPKRPAVLNRSRPLKSYWKSAKPILRLLAGWLVAAVILYPILWIGWRYLPPEHNPFREIDLSRPIGAATHTQLSRLADKPAACMRALEDIGIEYTALADDTFQRPCSVNTPINLEQSLYPYSAPLRMSCEQTAALMLWERQVVRPLAKKYLDSEVERINTFGSFSCRRIRGTDRYSQHAFANAIDVAGFRLKGGETISLLEDWDDRGKTGKFLKAVNERSCRIFSVVLGPEYDAAHADHFHLDMGPDAVCS